MAAAVYIACTLTSLACATLLLRSFGRTRVRLLLWSGLCFVGLSLNNLMLYLDTNVISTDLSVWRTIPALIGVGLLLYGLIWDDNN